MMHSQGAPVRDWLTDAGEVGRLLAVRDWSAHALGAPDRWPAGLIAALQTAFASSEPLLVWWGSEVSQFYNDACASIFHERHPAALAASAPEAWPALWETIGSCIRHVLDGERVVATAWSAPDGPVRIAFRPLTGEGGCIEGVVGSFRREDPAIESAGPPETSLLEREERYALAARATREAIWDCDLVTGQVRWNRAIADLFGWSEAMRGSSAQWWRARLHPDDLGRVIESIDHVLAAEKRTRWHAEYRFRRADGSYADIIDRGFIVRDRSGVARRMVGAMLDFTRTKRAEMALRESEARHRTLIELSPQLLWVARPDGGLDFCNHHWVEYTGLSATRQSDQSWVAAVDPEHRDRVLQAWLSATAAGTPFEMEIPFRRATDGAYRWHLARARPMRDTQETILNWMGIALDVHDRRQALAALEDADRRKDEFLATLAHELRNPLAPLRNALYLLQLQEQSVDAKQIHDIMDRQVRQLARLVDDLLDVSRVTRGKVGLQRRVVELAVVVEAAVEASRPLLDAARHAFTVTLPEAPVLVDADPTRLAQVFTNLINNAAKFTESGGRVWLVAERAEGEVVVTVGDTGIGIPRDRLADVFEMFRQLDGPPAHARGGLGIGLTLVKRLVQMHGGSVAARSGGVGLGSQFVVRLPVVEAAAGDAHDSARGAGSRGSPGRPMQRILVVDDNIDSAQSLALLLRRLGHDVRIAYDGESGLSTALAFRPDVVFLDLGLPGLTGHEVAQRLRGRFEPQQMRLIAVTGYGQATDRLRSSAAGFDQHLVKPVDWAALEMTLGA